MIEIVCPSCEARYRLPEGAIGESGRKVSCSACGHGWVAHPEPKEEAPLDLGSAAVAEAATPAPEPAPSAAQAEPAPGPAHEPAVAAPQREPAPAATAAAAGAAAATARSGHGSEMGGGRPAVQALPGQGKTYNPYTAYDEDEATSGTSPYADEEDRGMAAYEAFARAQRDEDEEDEDDDDFAARSGHSIEKLAGDRAQQMEQIKALLNEIKETPATTITPAAEDDEDDEYLAEQAARPSAVERTLMELEEEERDPLRAKLEEYHKPKQVSDVKANRNKMLKKHAKKVRRRKMEEAKGSGTFTTGVLLVVMILAIMVSIYLLSDILIEKVPEAEPAIRDYVATMDLFRIWAAEQIAAFQAWVDSLLEK